MQKTKIEWTRGEDGTPGRTANPFRARNKVTGKVGWHCVHHGPGCLHCYSERINKWVGTGLPFLKPSGDQVECFLDERVLRALLKLRDPQKVFLCDMTDIYGDWVEDEWLDKVFAVMALTPHITYQLLTKRPERMEAYVSGDGVCMRILKATLQLGLSVKELEATGEIYNPWPLRNVWQGVSCEDRKHGLPRVDVLRRVPAAVRFLSVEPLLEDLGEIDLTGIGWVVVGGESGPKARPMHPQWARKIRDHCVESGTPYFFKQWGAWAPGSNFETIPSGRSHNFGDPSLGDDEAVWQVGKKAAGRLLDGREWNQFPDPIGVPSC
jgi:protein gp37